MIEIRNLEGETLQVNPGQRLTIEQASTLMTDDELPGSFSYPISFPLNDANRRFLQYAYRPDALEARMELPVQVRLEGHLYRRCTFRYRIQDGKGDGFLKIDSGELGEKLRKQTLLEAIPDAIDLGVGLTITNGIAVPGAMKLYATLDPGREPFTFFPVRNEGFMEPVTEFNSTKLAWYQRQDGINAYNTFSSSFVVDTPLKLGFHAVPFFYLRWVLDRLMRGLGYRLEGDWIDLEETSRLVIFNQTAMMSASRSGSPFRIQAGMHLPDMTVSDFLRAIRQKYGLTFVFNAQAGVCRIRTFDSLRRQVELVDLSPYQLKGYSIEDGEQKGYSILEGIDEKDKLFQNPAGEILKPQPMVIGAGLTEVQLKVGSTKMTTWNSQLVPHVNQPGNLIDEIYKESDRYLENGKRPYPMALRLLSYRGIFNNVLNGTTYPSANGEYTQLTGRYGVWQGGLRSYYFFRDNTRKAEVRLLLPMAQLGKLNLDDRVGLRLEDRALTPFLINRWQFEAAESDSVLMRLECQTLPTGAEETADYENDSSGQIYATLEIRKGPMLTLPGNGGVSVIVQLADVVVKFYGSENRSPAVEVSGLPVVLRISTFSGFSATTNDVQLTASGTEFTLLNDFAIYRKVMRGAVVESESSAGFFLVPTDGYITLP
ncbi:hypothetical protein [Larkinella soli]|uniref:hypothetical protein n=1 Tax=Larkinella soli TaxID=1770527 RepID=UPI000FFCA2F4|nr:hypothetical protein [Larkinella soli]